MKLGSLSAPGSRDGRLIVVAPGMDRYLPAPDAFATLRLALDDWARAQTVLQPLYQRLLDDPRSGLPLEQCALMAPLPRAHEWLDGSAYLSHARLIRAARGAQVPPWLEHEPLMYQGGSGCFLGPSDDFPLPDAQFGLDCEAELAVVVTELPMGASREQLQTGICGFVLLNDWTYRHLVPHELAKGFGFLQSKPATAFAPLLVTPDELSRLPAVSAKERPAWDGERVDLAVRTRRNGGLLGRCWSGPEMHFSFVDLLVHATRTRSLAASTLIGSGTISNEDSARGVSCIAEQRMRERLRDGESSTEFLVVGERIEIEAFDGDGQSVFGALRQRVAPHFAPTQEKETQ